MTDPPVPSAATDPPTATELSLADRLASAVVSCHDVVGLSEGAFGEVATHLAGRRIRGVRLGQDLVEVHVIARWGTPLPEVAEQVRTACQPLAEGRQVNVSIDDVISEPEDVPADERRGDIPPATAQIS